MNLANYRKNKVVFGVAFVLTFVLRIFCRNSCIGLVKVSNTIKLLRIILLIVLNVGFARGFVRVIFFWCNIFVRKKLKLRLFVRKKSAS